MTSSRPCRTRIADRWRAPSKRWTRSSGRPTNRASSSPQEGGERFGPYLVLEELGRGGQGIVYLAEDTRLRRKVALKILDSKTVSTEALRRLHREARIAAAIDHPGICRVLDVQLTDRAAYVAMQFIPGRTLADLIQETRCSAADADLGDVVALVEAVADALGTAHGVGVVHRDVKPSNVMVKPDGQPVLLDFGLARLDGPEEQAITKAGTICGSPGYMAGEQIAGERIDARTDVHALGVVLYEYLTRQRPYEGDSAAEVHAAILAGARRDPRRLRPDIPGDLATIVETAMAREPQRRYANGSEFAEDLRRFRTNEPIRARKVGPITRMRLWIRRRPLAAALVFTIVIAVFGIGGLGTYLVSQRDTLALGAQRQVEMRRESLIADGFQGLLDGLGNSAERDFREALALTPDSPEATAGLAMALERRGRSEEADRIVEQLSTDADHPQDADHAQLAAILRAHLRNRRGEGERPTLNQASSGVEFFLVGVSAYQASGPGRPGIIRDAITAFRRAIWKAPVTRPVHYMMLVSAIGSLGGAGLLPHVDGGTEWPKADLELLEDSTRIMLERWPDSPACHYYAGYSWADADRERAIQVLEDGADRFPDDQRIARQLSWVLVKSGRHGRATKVAEALVARAPTSANYLALGRVHSVAGRTEDCMQAAQRSLERNPGELRARHLLGDCYWKLQRYAEAAEHYESATALPSNAYRAWNQLGSIYNQLGRLEDARHAFEQTIELLPSLAAGHFNLATILVQQGEIAKAQESIERSVELGAELHGELLEFARGVARLAAARKEGK